MTTILDQLRQNHIERLKPVTCKLILRDKIIKEFKEYATSAFYKSYIEIEYNYKDWWGLTQDQVYWVIDELHKYGLRVDRQYDYKYDDSASRSTLISIKVSFDFCCINFATEYLKAIDYFRNKDHVYQNKKFDVEYNVSEIFVMFKCNPSWTQVEVGTFVSVDYVHTPLQYVPSEIISQVAKALSKEGFDVRLESDVLTVSFRPIYYMEKD